MLVHEVIKSSRDWGEGRGRGHTTPPSRILSPFGSHGAGNDWNAGPVGSRGEGRANSRTAPAQPRGIFDRPGTPVQDHERQPALPALLWCLTSAPHTHTPGGRRAWAGGRELSLLWTKSDQVQQVLPPPRLFLEPRFPVRLGTPATYECVGAYGSNAYMLMLHKPGQQPQTVKWVRSEWEGRVGKFPMGNVTAEQAGLYSCMYQFDELYSKYSNEVPLVIRAVTMSPFLWVTPTTTPSFRQSLTFHCNSTSASDQYCLYHGSMEEWKPCIEALNKSKHEALFYYREVHRYVLGQYVCMTYNSSRPYQWSEISNTLLITLGGAPPFPFALWPHHIHVALTSAALGELLA
ncbi:natural cytotoxicity triggering receptor 1-like isoform X1 [Notamacropus eugenii]|uniref:natural cytotoxicity triggering receptor 1-like isoform X1 n=1 Tax=Notamacropus eugenii TaxID=9315 RepID=UPI003B675AF6